jgi:MinD superfamily P-loop ATPase
MVEMPIIDVDRCDRCGLCVGVCECGALVLVGNMITVIETAECDWCTDCEAVCRTGAIRCPFEIIVQES